MRILIPFVGDSVGGSHRSVIELVKGLRGRGIDAVIVVHDPNGPLASVLEHECVPYRFLPANRLAGESPSRIRIGLGVVRHFWRVRNYIKSHGADVVHGNDLRINLTWSLASRLAGAKFVWHQRTTLSNSRYWRLIPYLCDHFIAISGYVSHSAPANIPRSKHKLVVNPFNTSVKYDRTQSRDRLIRKYGLREDVSIIGYLGRLVDWKNVPLLLAGIARIVHEHHADSAVHLLIVGTGNEQYQEYLYGLVDRLEIRRVVTFAGFSRTPQRVLAGLDIAVMPSGREAFGRTVVEAMIQGTPVIAAGAGGHEEIIKDNINGMLYESDSVEDFVRRILPMIRDPTIGEKLADRAYSEAVVRYDVERHVDAMIAIYNSKREPL